MPARIEDRRNSKNDVHWPAESATQTNRVLVVEDSSSDLELTLRALARCGVTDGICVARDGAEALDFMFCAGDFVDRCILEQPCLVLLDLKIPLIHGMDVLRSIRAEPRTRRVPVVVMSSSSRQQDVIESYRHGANSYIAKPVGFDEFLETMSLIVTYWLRLNRAPLHAVVTTMRACCISCQRPSVSNPSRVFDVMKCPASLQERACASS